MSTQIKDKLELYTAEDRQSIEEIRNVFIKAHAKFNIFKYITQKSNEYMIGIQPGLKYLLLETLFRHTILELYTIFFDDDHNSIAQIVKKFKKNIGIKVKDADNDELKKMLGLLTKLKKQLNTYRNNALAHKSSINKLQQPDNQFNITIDDFDKLISVSKRLMESISNEVHPNTKYCHDLFLNGMDKDETIRAFFKILGM